MTATPDHHDHYTVTQALPVLVGVERSACTEITLGVSLVLHRLAVSEAHTRQQEIERQLRLWGAVRHPRLPLLVDAWFHGESIEWVTTDSGGDPLGSPESVAPLGRGPSFTSSVTTDDEIAWQTLDALAALHEQGISHRALRAECFRVTPEGLVFLWEWALCARLSRLVSEPAGGMRFELSTNLLGRDVADWGLMMAELLTSRQFISRGPVGEPPDLDPSPDTLFAAQEALRAKYGRGALLDFMVRAIDGRREAHRGFPNAMEARAAFPLLARAAGVPA